MWTPTTSGIKFSNILKQTRAIETTLDYFSSCLFGIKMAPKSLIMTKRKYTSKVMIRKTPPNDLVRIILEKLGIIPKEIFDLWKKLGFILLRPIRRNITSDKVVHNISKPRSKRNRKKVFIRKRLIQRYVHGGLHYK